MLLSLKRNKTYKEASRYKIIDLHTLKERVRLLREQGKTIATINGSFDLLHAGHLEIIYQAALQADILIVGLNTDHSIQLYKHPDRPIITLEYRLQMMAALEMVDYVSWFEETDPRNWLLNIRPDVHINGAEYGAQCIEAEVLREIGARLYLVDRIDGLATSDVIKKVQAVCV